VDVGAMFVDGVDGDGGHAAFLSRWVSAVS
jgi:hypothetical protein